MDISIRNKGRYNEHTQLSISCVEISKHWYVKKVISKLLDYFPSEILSNKSGDYKNKAWQCLWVISTIFVSNINIHR